MRPVWFLPGVDDRDGFFIPKDRASKEVKSSLPTHASDSSARWSALAAKVEADMKTQADASSKWHADYHANADKEAEARATEAARVAAEREAAQAEAAARKQREAEAARVTTRAQARAAAAAKAQREAEAARALENAAAAKAEVEASVGRRKPKNATKSIELDDRPKSRVHAGDDSAQKMEQKKDVQELRAYADGIKAGVVPKPPASPAIPAAAKHEPSIPKDQWLDVLQGYLENISKPDVAALLERGFKPVLHGKTIRLYDSKGAAGLPTELVEKYGAVTVNNRIPPQLVALRSPEAAGPSIPYEPPFIDGSIPPPIPRTFSHSPSGKRSLNL